VDKKLAAERIRARLEKRVALLLGCQAGELPRMKLGAMVHLLFLLEGHEQGIGGFEASIVTLIAVLGYESVWSDKVEEEPTPQKPVVN
jgi:hypothetical protein